MTALCVRCGPRHNPSRPVDTATPRALSARVPAAVLHTQLNSDAKLTLPPLVAGLAAAQLGLLAAGPALAQGSAASLQTATMDGHQAAAPQRSQAMWVLAAARQVQETPEEIEQEIEAALADLQREIAAIEELEMQLKKEINAEIQMGLLQAEGSPLGMLEQVLEKTKSIEQEVESIRAERAGT